MQKLFLALGVFALLTTSSAQASRSRYLVLGNGNPNGAVSGRGSLFYEDLNNVFYNPAYINDQKGFALIEKGNGAGVAGQAEGGLGGGFLGNYHIGLFFNRGDASSGTYSASSNMRPVDFILGGDVGLKWGLGLSYGSYKALTGAFPASTTRLDQDLTFRYGMTIAEYEPFIWYKLIGKNELSDLAGTHKLKNKDWGAGLRYRFGEWTPYLSFRQTNFPTVSGSTSSTRTSTDNKTTYYSFGMGRSFRAMEGLMMNYSTGFHRQKVSTGSATSMIPLDMSAEAEVTSWFIARGGFSYHLMDTTNGNSNAANTDGRVGAGLKWNKAQFDWAVGMGGANAETLNSSNFDVSSGFFTSAAFTYYY